MQKIGKNRSERFFVPNAQKLYFHPPQKNLEMVIPERKVPQREQFEKENALLRFKPLLKIWLLNILANLEK